MGVSEKKISGVFFNAFFIVKFVFLATPVDLKKKKKK